MPFQLDSDNFEFIDQTGEKTTWSNLLNDQRQFEQQQRQKNSDSSQRFGAVEHQFIGDEAFARLLESRQGRGIEQALGSSHLGRVEREPGVECHALTFPNGVGLSAGDIITLAGDFYGIADKPICLGADAGNDTKAQRFAEAFNSLLNAAADEIRAILKLVREEMSVVRAARRKGFKPNLALDAISGDVLSRPNRQFSKITENSSWLPSLFYSRYGDLALNNLDHFGENAIDAYETGHKVALATARNAAEKVDANEEAAAQQLLAQAFAQELFACHYLTDLFASGHMRTPRKALKELTPSTYVAGQLAKAMHDEDGRNGLWVKSEKKPEGWLSKGDHCLFCDDSQVMQDEAVAAVQAVLKDVFDTYCDSSTDQDRMSYKTHLPQVDGSKNNTKNPLFRVRDTGDVELRKKLHDPSCDAYFSQNDWSPVATAAKLMLFSSPKEQLSPEEKNELIDEIAREMQQLEPLEEQGYRPSCTMQ